LGHRPDQLVVVQRPDLVAAAARQHNQVGVGGLAHRPCDLAGAGHGHAPHHQVDAVLGLP
jgi:hypothetical protein